MASLYEMLVFLGQNIAYVTTLGSVVGPIIIILFTLLNPYFWKLAATKPLTTTQLILSVLFGSMVFVFVTSVFTTALASPFVDFGCLTKRDENCIVEDDEDFVKNTYVVVGIVLCLGIILSMYKRKFGNLQIDVMKMLKL